MISVLKNWYIISFVFYTHQLNQFHTQARKLKISWFKSCYLWNLSIASPILYFFWKWSRILVNWDTGILIDYSSEKHSPTPSFDYIKTNWYIIKLFSTRVFTNSTKCEVTSQWWGAAKLSSDQWWGWYSN